MPLVTKHKHGSFCWVELVTSDTAAAKKFYTQLFGWGVEDLPMGGGSLYHMLTLNGKYVGALYARDKEQQHIPPHWGSFVSVDDVDAMSRKIGGLGGKTLKPPFDVFDAGRMTFIQDPTGAVLALWQAKKNIGAGVVNEAGATCWSELATGDPKAAGAFYSGLFGWDVRAVPSTLPYDVFSNGGTDIGGMYTLTEDMKGVPPHWLPYFSVRDCDAAAQKTVSLGGTQVIPPTDIPNTGRFAYVRDPQGAMFAIIKLIPR